ncbi:uncharacterized protein LOC135493301 [Lineus longissimus]|uniref:uncharacterized protein LOC135493301 n=1 Tax=Lineus longissimus TaxID=88925 RepID=UPI002B4DCAC2
METAIFALAAVCLCGVMFGSGADAVTCPPNPRHGHFQFLGSARDVSHYRLICHSGFQVTPPRGDTLLSCRGSRPIVGGRMATCSSHVMTCLSSEFKCKRKQECIPRSVVCDGRYHCLDKTDESPSVCNGRRGMACTPRPDWMHGDPNFVFQRVGIQSNTGIVEYGVSCVEGYRLKGHHRDTPFLQCSAGNVIRKPRVHCERIPDGQPCILMASVDYVIENYHDDQLDLDIDNHSEQQPGTLLTVRCRNGRKNVTVYCNLNGIFEGLPDCSRQ